MLHNARRSSGSLLAPDAAAAGTAGGSSGSVLRRAGAVRYKLTPSDANASKLGSKSNNGSSPAAEDISTTQPKPSGRISRAIGRSRHSSHSQSEPVTVDLPGYSRRSRLRCACIAQFLHLIDRGTYLRPTGPTGTVDFERPNVLPSGIGRLSLPLVPDERIVIQRIREQVGALFFMVYTLFRLPLAVQMISRSRLDFHNL